MILASGSTGKIGHPRIAVLQGQGAPSKATKSIGTDPWYAYGTANSRPSG